MDGLRKQEEGRSSPAFFKHIQKKDDMLLLKFLMAGAVVMAVFISYITMQEGAREERIRELLGDEDPESTPTP